MNRRFLFYLPAIMVLLSPLPVRAADPLPAAASVAGISGHPQALSLDCEARSAADWAAFFGVAIDEMTFFNQLPKTDNPETGFVGSVYDSPGNLPPRGYGVYAAPVAALLDTYGLAAQVLRNASESNLQSEIAAGRPVIVWYIYGFRVTPTVNLTSADGSVYRAAAFEHTGIVIGYDPATYTVIDAFSGMAHRVDRTQFLNSWAVLGNMAILGGGQPLPPLAETPPSPPPSSTPTYYTVQPGDFLSKIAQQLGVDWRELARINNLYDPYVIHPGDQLLIPGTGTPLPAAPAPAQPAPGAGATYTVQPGDTLSRIAQTFGLYWPALAEANNILWPYTIYPGQVLILPGR